MRSQRTPARRLRASIEAMPLATREAMLEGIASNEIIVGAYVDNKTKGICPMLAAHRCGGRTNFGTFARAWDGFTGANPKKPRPATRKEVRALRSYLERSLIGAEVSDEPLAGAVRDVQASRRRLSEAEAQDDAALTVEQMLAETGAAAEEERNERTAAEVLGTEAQGTEAPGTEAAAR